MSRLITVLTLAALLSASLVGQAPAPSTFEFADVRSSAPPTFPNQAMRGGALRAGNYEIYYATMVDLIRLAYGVTADKVTGGPNWLEMDRFDVVAKAPPSTTPDAARQMLRTLLADRFTLVVEEASRQTAGWALKVAQGGAKMKESTAPASQGCQGQPQPPHQVVACRGLTVKELIETLPQIANAYITGLPIADKTGLGGRWDFELRWTARAQLAQAGADAITLPQALDRQLGLTLESDQVSAELIDVASVSRLPTPNAPDIAKRLPTPPPPQFEVAVVKRSPPDAGQMQARILPNGQIDAVNVPLKEMIFLAWGINSDDRLVAPAWIADARFDITGKAFSNPEDAPFLGEETVRLMLRALLVDRFRMKTHFEDRRVRAYTLTAEKPRMTKGDPSARSKCWEGPKPGAPDPRAANPSLRRLLTCQNVTMEQFVTRLWGFAGGYVRSSIADVTGLEGGWDLVLNFSPIGMFPGGVDGLVGSGNVAQETAAAVAAGTASVPLGALTLPEALERQLGLKLQMGDRVLPVLVVDSMEREPVE